MKKNLTIANVFKPLTKDVIRQSLPDPKQYFFFVNEQYIYNLYNLVVPEYLQNLGVTIEEVPCFYKAEERNGGFDLEKVTKTERNAEGYYDCSRNNIVIYYPVFLIEQKVKDFLKIERNEKSVLVYQHLVRDNFFYLLLHELRHAYNFQLLQKFSMNKGIQYTDLFKFAFFDEFSAEFSSVCARINNGYLLGYKSSVIRGRVIDTLKEIVCNNDNIEEGDVYQKIETYLCEYMENGQKDGNYDIDNFLCVANRWMHFLPHKNLVRNSESEKNFELLKSKILTFDLYNPQKKQMESVDFSKYTKSLLRYDEPNIHEILDILYMKSAKDSKNNLEKNNMPFDLNKVKGENTL